MKKVRFIIALILIVGLLNNGIYIKETNASFITSGSITNRFATADIGIANIENGEDGFVDSGNLSTSPIEKRVQVRNSKTCSVVLRTALIPRWVTDDGKPCAGDASYIKLNETKNVTKDITKWKESEEALWYESDGYYYYNKLLNPEEISEVLIDSVSVDMPESLKNNYYGKKVIVDVRSEAVVAAHDTYDNVWNVDENIKDKLDSLLIY